MHQAELMEGQYLGQYMEKYMEQYMGQYMGQYTGCKRVRDEESGIEGPSVKVRCPQGTSCACWNYTLGPSLGPATTPVGASSSRSSSAAVSSTTSGNGTPQYQYLLEDCSCEIEDYMYQGYATDSGRLAGPLAGQPTGQPVGQPVSKMPSPIRINDMYQSQQALSNIEPVQYSLYDVIDE